MLKNRFRPKTVRLNAWQITALESGLKLLKDENKVDAKSAETLLQLLANASTVKIMLPC